MPGNGVQHRTVGHVVIAEGNTDLGYTLHRYRAFARLTPSEEATLSTLGEAETVHRKGDVLQREGDPVHGFHLHIRGWIGSSITLYNGDRLIQKVHLPGDMLGTPGMVVPRAADTLTAITEATTAFVPSDRLGQLFVDAPRLAALFVMAIQMERLALMDTLATTSNASARERLARLLVDLHLRLSAIGEVTDDGFVLPLTQEAISDLIGLTPVHVNRTIRSMEESGLIARQGHRFRLLDLPALRDLTPVKPRQPEFEPAWLPPAG